MNAGLAGRSINSTAASSSSDSVTCPSPSGPSYVRVQNGPAFTAISVTTSCAPGSLIAASGVRREASKVMSGESSTMVRASFEPRFLDRRPHLPRLLRHGSAVRRLFVADHHLADLILRVNRPSFSTRAACGAGRCLEAGAVARRLSLEVGERAHVGPEVADRRSLQPGPWSRSATYRQEAGDALGGEVVDLTIPMA